MSAKVLVIYKSGAQVTVKCDKFKVTRSPRAGLTEVSWENANPSPLHLGVDEVAAVWELL